MALDDNTTSTVSGAVAQTKPPSVLEQLGSSLQRGAEDSVRSVQGGLSRFGLAPTPQGQPPAPPATPSVADTIGENIGGLAPYAGAEALRLGGKAAQLAPWAPVRALGKAAEVAGTVATPALVTAQTVGDIQQRRDAEAAARGEAPTKPSVTDDLKDLATGGVSAALFHALPGAVGSRVAGVLPAATSTAGRIASRAAEHAVGLGVTSGVNTELERAAAGQDLASPEAIHEVGQSAVAGGLLGAPFGVAHGALERAPPPVAEPAGPITAALRGMRNPAQAMQEGVAAGHQSPFEQVQPEQAEVQGPPPGPAKPIVDNAGNVRSYKGVNGEEIEAFNGLDQNQRAVEQRAANQVMEDPAKAVQDYRNLPGTDGGRIISTDEARELFPDYNSGAEGRSANALAVHEPSSYVAKEVWREELERPPAADKDPTVLFTAGGTGAGKTTGVKAVPEIQQAKDKADIVYDGNLQSFKSANEKITEALNTGRNVNIVYVNRDPIDAFVNGALPRAARDNYGRTVPIDVHANTHIGAAKTIAQIADFYKDDPRVDVQVINNKTGETPSVGKIGDVAPVAATQYNTLRSGLVDALHAERAAGNVPDRVWNSYGKEDTQARPGSGSEDARAGGIAQPEGVGVQGGAGDGRQLGAAASQTRPAQEVGAPHEAPQAAFSRPTETSGRSDAASGGRERGVAGEKVWTERPAREHSVAVSGIHYSNTAGLDKLDGRKYGTNHAGAEAQRLADEPKGSPIRNRVYYYPDSSPLAPKGESVVGRAGKYKLNVGNSYDAQHDPLGLGAKADVVAQRGGGWKNAANEFEKLIVRNGFDGYHTDEMGVVLGSKKGIDVAAKLSRPENEGTHTIESLAHELAGSSIGRALGKLERAGKLDIVHDTQSEPWAGKWENGRATLNAAWIEKNGGVGLVLHELGVHGSRLGDMLTPAGLERVNRLMDRMTGADADLVKQAEGRIPKDTPADLKAEERVAYFVELAAKQGKMTAPVRATFALVSAKLKAALLDTQFGKLLERYGYRLSSDDVVSLARAAVERAGRNVTMAATPLPQAHPGGPLFTKPDEWKKNAREFVKDSRVKGVVYHATSADFNEFDTSRGDLGSHFGTQEQANKASGRNRGTGAGPSIIPAYINLRNPLRLKDVGSFHADGIAPQLARRGWITGADARRIVSEIDKDWKLRSKYDPMLRDLIKERGYDGVVYKNETEGKGDSYIVFDPRQVKSAIGNSGAFDKDNPDVRYSRPTTAYGGDIAKQKDNIANRIFEKPYKELSAEDKERVDEVHQTTPLNQRGAMFSKPLSSYLQARRAAKRLEADALEKRELGRGAARAAWAEQARAMGRADQTFKQFRDAYDNRPKTVREDPKQNYAGVIAFQQGKQISDPMERAFLETSDKMLSAQAKEIQDLETKVFGAPKLGLLENYFPQLWEDPAQAQRLYEGTGKKPLGGNKKFLKERTFADMQQGIEAGFKPKFENPADTIMARYEQGEKYKAMLRIMGDLKDRNLLKEIGPNDRVPVGYARVNDFSFGNKLVPELVAKDLNNYLSPGLGQFKAWRGFRALENRLLTSRLGFSLFHAGFSTFDSTMTDFDAGLRYAFGGEFSKAVSHLSQIPIAPLKAAMELAGRGSGSKLVKQWLGDPANLDANTRAIFHALAEGGARARMDATDWNNDLTKTMREWRRNGVAGVAKNPMQTMGGVLEATMHHVAHNLVPAQKMVARMTMMKLELDRAIKQLNKSGHYDIAKNDYKAAVDALNPDYLRKVASGVNRRVDDRLGQMAYDNLFWNRTIKDMAQGTIQSVGWNVGTGSVILGGLRDIARLFKPEMLTMPLDKAGKITKAQMSRITGRLSYFIALNMGVGAAGAIYQYLATGKGPEELRDYFFPKTGDKNPDGTDARISFPSYVKDEFGIIRHPKETVEHKLHPALGMAVELMNNKDFFGNQIHNPNDPWQKQAGQLADYIVGGFKPYAVQNQEQIAKQGGSTLKRMLPFIGITPAPSDITKSDFQNFVNERYYEKHKSGGKTPEEAAFSKARNDAVQAVRAGQNPDLSQFTPAQRATIHRYAKSDLITSNFQRLSLDDKLAAWEYADDAEKKKYRPFLLKNAMKSIANAPVDERDALRARLQKVKESQ